eukprot:gene8523-4822_t
MHFLDHYDNSGNSYSDANYTAAFLEGLGFLRMGLPRALSKILKQIDRHLALEEIAASPHYVVGTACLGALTNLAINLTGDSRDDVRDEVRKQLKCFALPGQPYELRRSAISCLMALEVAAGKLEGLVSSMLRPAALE